MMAELWTRVCAESGARGHDYSLLHAMGRPNVEKDASTKEAKVWGEAAKDPGVSR